MLTAPVVSHYIHCQAFTKINRYIQKRQINSTHTKKVLHHALLILPCGAHTRIGHHAQWSCHTEPPAQRGRIHIIISNPLGHFTKASRFLSKLGPRLTKQINMYTFVNLMQSHMDMEATFNHPYSNYVAVTNIIQHAVEDDRYDCQFNCSQLDYQHTSPCNTLHTL